ncbi:hypothetical protein [Pseudoduganella lutea]|uniref:Flagellar hook-length control protein FliK n=1 Tax=Pseudoduganella lutea TaxID=321985 RepID=A0A4P6L2C2_9BURK|nr:hypothetical protein [Pseudoduganella lutea]QBE65660.1 hypothetical protein EWM63_23965 [Pseudoduganella lutea]
MAIDRVIPSSATLTIHDRIARERPGQQPPPFQAAQSPAGPAQATFDPGIPGATPAAVALLEAIEGRPAAMPAALARTLAAEAMLADAVSMQPNQLFMSRQMVWHAQDPSALAASWMAMIRTYGEQRAALAAQSRGRHVPASLFQSDAAPQVLREGRLPQQLISELDAWRFAVYAWGGEKLVLRVVTRNPDEDDGPSHQHARVALRLEIHLPDLGKVVLQMEPAEGGFVLEIGAAQAGAMQYIRALLPEIGAIAARCSVRILRVRLMRQLPAPGLAQPDRMGVALLTAPVFKTMADVAVLLSQPSPAGERFHEPAR